MKVLLAEDDPIARRMLTALLTDSGYEVIHAHDGQEALEIWQRHRIRLVISDWIMPGLEGPELVQQIRSDDSLGYTYIILVTIKDRKGDVVQGLEAGADDYLTKPFDEAELRARVAIGRRILDLEARLSESLARVERLARQDSLTGLFNRRYFVELAEREVIRVRRYGGPLSAIMLDVDRFKNINDQYSHAVGDRVLVAIAERCRQNVRDVDLLARYGGEEFIVLLPESGMEVASRVAERLRTAVAEMRVPPGGNVSVTISLGVAELTSETPDLAALIDRADAALYGAKREGRNRVATRFGRREFRG